MWLLSLIGLLAQSSNGNVQQLRQEILQANDPTVCGDYLRQLTRTATLADLDLLRCDAHPAVASFASLELLARAANESPEVFLFEHGRFTGRLEQIFGLTTPTEVILAARQVVRPHASADPAVWPDSSASYGSRSQPLPKFPARDELYLAGERSSPEVIRPRGTRKYLLGGCLFADTTDGIEWRSGMKRGKVDKPKGDEFANSLFCVVGHATDTCCVVYFFEIMGSGGILQMYDTESARKVWVARVWGTNYVPRTWSGPTVHPIKIVVTKVHATVLGIVPSRPHFYIERFDVATGKPDGRFATNYWQQLSRKW